MEESLRTAAWLRDGHTEKPNFWQIFWLDGAQCCTVTDAAVPRASVTDDRFSFHLPI